MAKTQAKHTCDIMNQAREEMAEKLLDISEVKKKILENAKRGLGMCRIKMDAPITLEKTKHAQKLVNELAQAGYQVDWDKIVLPASRAGNEFDLDVHYKELLITWEKGLII